MRRYRIYALHVDLEHVFGSRRPDLSAFKRHPGLRRAARCRYPSYRPYSALFFGKFCAYLPSGRWLVIAWWKDNLLTFPRISKPFHVSDGAEIRNLKKAKRGEESRRMVHQEFWGLRWSRTRYYRSMHELKWEILSPLMYIDFCGARINLWWRNRDP